MLFLKGIHKFPKLVQLRKKNDVIRILGDNDDIKNVELIVTEKLDGANVRIYNDYGTLEVYSRNTFLTGIHDAKYDKELFRGFTQFVTKNFEQLKGLIPDGHTVYGEWLVKHSVQYPNDMYGKLYLFHPYEFDKVEGDVKLVPRIGTYTYQGYEDFYTYAKNLLENYAKMLNRPVEGLVFSGFVDGEFVGFKIVLDSMSEKIKTGTSIDIPEAYKLIPNTTVEKRINDTLDDMNLNSLEELTPRDFKQFIGRATTKLYEDFLREILPGAVLFGPWKKIPQVSLKSIKSDCAAKVRDYLKDKGLL